MQVSLPPLPNHTGTPHPAQVRIPVLHTASRHPPKGTITQTKETHTVPPIPPIIFGVFYYFCCFGLS